MAFESFISKAWKHIKKLYYFLHLHEVSWLRRIVITLGDGILKVASVITRTSFHPGGNWGTEMRFVLGLYESDSVACSRKFIKSGMVVFDIGADIGYYTKLFSQLVGPNGKVYAFEPHEKMFKILLENTKQRRYQNVTAVQKALASKQGTASFFNMQQMGRHSLYNVADYHESLTVAKTTTVKTTTLDAFAADHNIANIDFFKIDVEGGELDVLLGAKEIITKTTKLMGIVEYSPITIRAAGRQPHDVISTLHMLGFKIKEIGKGGALQDIIDTTTLAFGKESVNLFCYKNYDFGSRDEIKRL